VDPTPVAAAHRPALRLCLLHDARHRLCGRPLPAPGALPHLLEVGPGLPLKKRAHAVLDGDALTNPDPSTLRRSSSIACVGYIIFLSVKINRPGVLYFASFLTVGSIAPCIATSLSWFQNNLQGHYKKAFVLGTAMTVGNSGCVITAPPPSLADRDGACGLRATQAG
jgi:hypothetical protein